MKLISFLLFVGACSIPCHPKYTEEDIQNSADYMRVQCLGARFDPMFCNNLVNNKIIEKHLENLDVRVQCLEKQQLK